MRVRETLSNETLISYFFCRELLLGDRDYKDKLSKNQECPDDRTMQTDYNRLSMSREKSGILENILSGI